MRRLSVLLVALLLGGAVVGGCGDSGSTDFAAIEQALAECSDSTMTGFLQIFYALVNVPDVLQGESPLPGFEVDVVLSVDPLDPPNTYDFTVSFDTNGNGIRDTSVVGKVTFSEDPTDGISPGATVNFDFTVQGGDLAGGETGTITGSGDILATVGVVTDEVRITGTVSLNDTAGDGCMADLTFPLVNPVNVFFDDTSGALAANTGSFDIFGTIQAIIESLGFTLDATLTLTQGDQTVNVMGDIDGTDVDFDFELLPSDEVMQQLAGCAFFGFEWSFFFTDTYEDIVAAIGGGTLPPGVVLTPTANPNVVNYAIDLAALDPGTFNAGTVTGQATLTFPTVQLSGIPPSSVAFTWTIAGAAFDSGDVASGQNATGRPFRLFLDGTGALVAYEGAGSVTIIPGAPPIASSAAPCVVTFDILPSDPITATESDGTAIITVTIGDEVLVFVIDFDAEEIAASVNGIPIPFFGF